MLKACTDTLSVPRLRQRSCTVFSLQKYPHIHVRVCVCGYIYIYIYIYGESLYGYFECSSSSSEEVYHLLPEVSTHACLTSTHTCFFHGAHILALKHVCAPSCFYFSWDDLRQFYMHMYVCVRTHFTFFLGAIIKGCTHTCTSTRLRRRSHRYIRTHTQVNTFAYLWNATASSVLETYL